MARFDTPVDHGFVSGVATEAAEVGHGASRGARKGLGAGILLGMAVVGVPLAAVGALGFLASVGWGIAGVLVLGGIGAVTGGLYGGTTMGVLGTAIGAIKGLFTGGKRIHDEKAAATKLSLDIQRANAEGAEHAREMQTQMIQAAQEEQSQRAAFLENILKQGKAEEKPHVERVEDQKVQQAQQAQQGAGIA